MGQTIQSGQDVTALMSAPPPIGLLAVGNIDVGTRPAVNNPDGSVSTVRSISINDNGKEILIPTVVNGRVVSNSDAIAAYRKTGQHLGVFDTPEHATAFAQNLHQQEAQRIAAPKSGEDVTHLMTPHYQTSNEKDAQGNAVVDPNTLGTVVRHIGAQINPITMIQTLGQAIAHPIDTTRAVGAAQGALFDKAKASYEQGDYLTAARHFVDYLIPLVGPGLDKSADLFQAGKWAAGGGDAIGLALAMFGPKALQNVAAARYPLANRPGVSAPLKNPAQQTLVEFGQSRGVPIDAATASDNFAVKGAQQLADRSLGGSVVATPANAARTAAMTRVGDELSTEAHPVPVTPEQAGESLRNALTAKIAGHTQDANTAYDALRELEGPQAAVDLTRVKTALQPVFDQMKRQMPLTQQQANPGLKAIQNIIEGDNTAPLSQVDRDLSAIKAVARQQGGLAKFAVSKLESAVQEAAARGGPDVVKALQQGRQATIAKYAASDVLDTLKAEPVRTIKALTAQKDAAIQALRTVTQQVPEQAPVIARAYLEDLLDKPQKVAEWSKLGSQTKAILFPKAGHAQALDNFFKLTDRISKTNVNPSGTGYTVSLATQGGALGTGLVLTVVNPAVGGAILGTEAAIQIGGAMLAKLLRSPAAVQALTRGMQIPNAAPVAMRVAATTNLIRAARAAGVELALPKAADQQPPTQGQR